MTKHYIEISPKDELPKAAGTNSTELGLSDDVYVILGDKERAIAYYDHSHKTWAGMFDYDNKVITWLKEVEVNQASEEDKYKPSYSPAYLDKYKNPPSITEEEIGRNEIADILIKYGLDGGDLFNATTKIVKLINHIKS